MNNFLSWLTRKKIISISFIFGGISVFFIYLDGSNKCFIDYRQCELVAYILILFIPIFIFSLLTYFSRIEVFNFWKKVTIIYLCIYLFLTVLVPFQCDAYLPICKKTLSLILIPTYLVISLFLIFSKTLQKE